VPYLETLIDAAAAFCTTISYVPQLKKSWTTGETHLANLRAQLSLTPPRTDPRERDLSELLGYPGAVALPL
jgi:hypothetical protein